MKHRVLTACALTAACLLGGTALAYFAPDPHTQIVEGIKVAAEACRAAAPRTEYERKVCALVAP